MLFQNYSLGVVGRPSCALYQSTLDVKPLALQEDLTANLYLETPPATLEYHFHQIICLPRYLGEFITLSGGGHIILILESILLYRKELSVCSKLCVIFLLIIK